MGVGRYLRGLIPLFGMIAGSAMAALLVFASSYKSGELNADVIRHGGEDDVPAFASLRVAESGPDQLRHLIAGQERAPAPKDEVRLALVIGNAAYQQTGWKLKNPVNDARLMATRLEQLGFDVDLVENATRQQMVDAYKRYGDRMSAAGSNAVSAIFYAGHGVQDEGVNYLIPVDAEIYTLQDVQFASPNMNSLMRYMKGAGNAVNLVFIDACRDNPLSSEERGRSTRLGLSDIEPTPNVLISYAALAGRTAADGLGDNSPYSVALVDALNRSPAQPISLVMEDVGSAVYEATGGRQHPEFRNGLVRAPRWSFARTPAASRDDPLKTLADYLDAIDYNKQTSITDLLEIIVETYGFRALGALADDGHPHALGLMA